jgi:hypothetical protein
VLVISAMTATKYSNSEKVSKAHMNAASVLLLVALAIVIVWPTIVRSRQPCKNACAMNLRAIEGAKATWTLENKKLPTDTPTDADLFGSDLYILKKPQCPDGGVYTLGTICEKPKCSVAGHSY